MCHCVINSVTIQRRLESHRVKDSLVHKVDPGVNLWRTPTLFVPVEETTSTRFLRPSLNYLTETVCRPSFVLRTLERRSNLSLTFTVNKIFLLLSLFPPPSPPSSFSFLLPSLPLLFTFPSLPFYFPFPSFFVFGELRVSHLFLVIDLQSSLGREGTTRTKRT